MFVIIKKWWNEDKCRCECKEYKGICDKGFNWNPSNFECECDKSCDAGEYLDHKNSKCRKMLVDKLVEKGSENIVEKEQHPNKMIYNSTVTDYYKIRSSCERSSCTIYMVLSFMFFIISISIISVFIYFNWHLQRKYIERTIYWMQFHWMQFHWTYKWEILSKLVLKIVPNTFLMTWSALKNLIQA